MMIVFLIHGPFLDFLSSILQIWEDEAGKKNMPILQVYTMIMYILFNQKYLLFHSIIKKGILSPTHFYVGGLVLAKR